MANIVDLQTLCMGQIVPTIPSLLPIHHPLHDLPHHLRERLFKYIIAHKCLYQFPDVARIMEFFAHEYMEEFDVAKNGRYITDAVLKKIFGCFNLKRLSLRKVCGVSSDCLMKLIRHTPLLQKLHLVAIPYLSDKLLSTISKVCRHLEDFAIIRSDSISDKGLKKFASTCSGKLLKVSLFGCSNLSDKGLIPFFASNPHLVSVNVSRLQTNMAIKSLLELSSTLRELLIAKCRTVEDSSLSRLSQPPLCNTITSLDLSTLRLSTLTLSTIASQCSNLQILYLPFCPHATDDVMLQLGTKLRKLYVPRNAQLSDAALAQVVATNPNLEVLNATSCIGIGVLLLQALTSECRFTLTTLYLARCNISKTSLQNLVEKCPELTSLDVCGCTNAVDDGLLSSLALACRKVKLLDISDCYNVTLEGIEEVAKSLAQLDSLSMASTYTSDAHLNVLAEGVGRELTTLNISGCYLLTPNFLLSFVQTQRSLAKLYASTFSSQAFITKNSSDFIDKMRSENNNVIIPISPSKPTHQCLEALFFADWPALSIDHLLPILPYCLNLETLILARCQNFDDSALAIISNFCKSLVYLDIAQCGQISSTGIISISENCHLLQNLLANSCTKIGDAGLQGLIAHCPMLVELALSRTRVSDDSVQHTTALRNLSILAVRGTLVTRKLVAKLKQRHPTLTVTI